MSHDARSPGSFPWDTGDACRAEVGASLPPRKRLLAGLKQNGWLSSSPSYAGAWQSSGSPCTDLMEEVKLEVDLEGAKMVEEPVKLERGGECLGESAEGTIVEVGTNADEVMDSEKCESGSKRPKSSSPASNSPGPVKKKPRMNRESNNHRESNLRRKLRGSKAVPSSNSAVAASRSKRETVSHREMAAAAKLTAAMAAKTAAEAKAIAADKAAAAAKAAAVAKAALEAVAIAACDDAWKPRRNSTRGHPKAGVSREKQRSREAELKREVEPRKVSQMPPTIDDEELARQLHRAMNSSPRISRCLTPVHRKEDGAPSQRPLQGKHQHRRRSSSLKEVKKLEVMTSRQSFESSQSRSGEADVKSKSMTAINDTCSLQRVGFPGNEYPLHIAADSPASQGHLDKAECLNEGDMQHSSEETEKNCRMICINENCGITHDDNDDSITKFTPVSKNASVHSNTKILLNLDSEVWAEKSGLTGVEVEQSANHSAKISESKRGNKKWMGKIMPSDEIQDVHYERDSEDADKESSMTIEQSVTPPKATEEGNAKAALIGVMESCKEVDSDKVELPAEIPGSTKTDLKGEDEVSGFTRYDNIGFENQEEKLKHEEVKESSSARDVSKAGRLCSDSRSKTVSKSLSQSTHGHGDGGQSWHQEILKGLSSGKQSFGGSMNIAPFRSVPPVSLRTPTFASGPTGRHS